MSDGTGPPAFATTPPGRVVASFEVPIGAAGGLAVATSALARKLAWLACEPGQHDVIVDSPDVAWGYTQCLVDPAEGAWAEAMSNRFITDAGARLGRHQLATLISLGFNPPDDDVPNHWCVHPLPVEWTIVAAQLTIPMASVYGLGPHDALTVQISPHIRREA